MKVGFTGTRQGMTEAQKVEVRAYLTWHRPISTFQLFKELEAHHGDCVGADDDFNTLAVREGYKIIAHPASDTGRWRAFCKSDVVLLAKPALVRNRDIVDVADVVLATPKSNNEEFRGSGTWAAIRYAFRTGKHFRVIYPDGHVIEDDWEGRAVSREV